MSKRHADLTIKSQFERQFTLPDSVKTENINA
ncbi:MAG: Hsp20/alpha crystallin family protein [Calditrichaeota bacterium]|nr:MAG: Hsp20/alpha crystallin family protein [Calditrichota bacterium]